MFSPRNFSYLELALFCTWKQQAYSSHQKIVLFSPGNNIVAVAATVAATITATAFHRYLCHGNVLLTMAVVAAAHFLTGVHCDSQRLSIVALVSQHEQLAQVITPRCQGCYIQRKRW